jgi:hypothetical protein
MEMNRNTAGLAAIACFIGAILFGLMTSAAVEMDRPWLTIMLRFVPMIGLLFSGLIYAAKARR